MEWSGLIFGACYVAGISMFVIGIWIDELYPYGYFGLAAGSASSAGFSAYQHQWSGFLVNFTMALFQILLYIVVTRMRKRTKILREVMRENEITLNKYYSPTVSKRRCQSTRFTNEAKATMGGELPIGKYAIPPKVKSLLRKQGFHLTELNAVIKPKRRKK